MDTAMTAKGDSRISPALRGLKARCFQNIRRTSPLLILRILAAIIVFLPWLSFALVCSYLKMAHWRKPRAAREFMKRHRLAFSDIDESTLEVESVSGGVSNSNQIWHVRTQDGRPIDYFVKIFVSAGSFWARHLSLVSPFPAIYGQGTHERFTVDMISRVQLQDRHIPVPRLIAFDAVEKVMVTEYLKGQNVDSVLKEISLRGSMEPVDEDVIRKCGEELAQVHNAGFSLIDTQPVNCIWVAAEKKVYFTDLEFCTRDDKIVWDVGFFLCFLALRLPGELKRRARELFLLSYQKERRLNLAAVAETGLQLKAYLPIFQTILDIRQFTPEELFEELLTGP